MNVILKYTCMSQVMNGVTWWFLYIQKIKVKKISTLDLLYNIFQTKMQLI
nr:MAG TPA: hypothetical protein [Caudoviricetes sp.]